jgi:hypothetical protein
MPKDKFKPKEFADFEKKKSYVALEDRVERLEKGRTAPEEGEFNRSSKDVREDYFADEKRAEEDRGEKKEQKRRPLKQPRKMIRKWDTRSAKRRNSSR